MTPATWPRDDASTTRLLHIDPASGAFEDRAVGDLLTLLEPQDVLVVNDAATLPASLQGATGSGARVEARLLGARLDGTFGAVLFGAGDWRTRTEDRPPPPPLRAGDGIQFDGLRATVTAVEEGAPRLVSLAFDARGDNLWGAIYRAGHPVQYAYTAGPLALWHVQTPYAGRPWAAEAPSAGFGLTWDLLLRLRRRGVALARVTHAGGLSSTGDPGLDARLPLAEAYEVLESAVEAIQLACERGGRVVAVGTTAARALEGAAANGGGRLRAGTGTTDLRLGPSSPRRVVDGILTGVHERDSSHFSLLQAFAPRALLEEAHEFAGARGYRAHEFGDAVLVLATRAGGARTRGPASA